MRCCIPYRRPGEGVLALLYSQPSTLITNMRKSFAYSRKINSTKPFCQMLLQIPLVLLDKLRSQSRSFIKRILSLHDIRYALLTSIHFFPPCRPRPRTACLYISCLTRAELLLVLSLHEHNLSQFYLYTRIILKGNV